MASLPLKGAGAISQGQSRDKVHSEKQQQTRPRASSNPTQRSKPTNRTRSVSFATSASWETIDEESDDSDNSNKANPSNPIQRQRSISITSGGTWETVSSLSSDEDVEKRPKGSRMPNIFRPRGDEYLTKLPNGNLAMARSVNTKAHKRARSQSNPIMGMIGQIFGSSSRSIAQLESAPPVQEAQVSQVPKSYHGRHPSHSRVKPSRNRSGSVSLDRSIAIELPDYSIRITPKGMPGVTKSHRANMVGANEATPTPPPSYPTYPPQLNQPAPWGQAPPSTPIFPQQGQMYQHPPYFQAPPNPAHQSGQWIYPTPQDSARVTHYPDPDATPRPTQRSTFASPPNPGHVCANCGNARSERYQYEHPIRPGELPLRHYCRKCENWDTGTEGSGRTTPPRRGKAQQKGQPRRKRHSKAKPFDNKGANVVTESDYSSDSDYGRDRSNLNRNKRHGKPVALPARSRVSSGKEGAYIAAPRPLDNTTGSYVRMSSSNAEQPSYIEQEHLRDLSPASERIKASALDEIQRRVAESSQSSMTSITVVPISEEKLVVEDKRLNAMQGQGERFSFSSRRQAEHAPPIEPHVFHPQLPSDIPSLNEGSVVDVTYWHTRNSKNLPPEIGFIRPGEVVATREHFEGPLHHHENRSSSRKGREQHKTESINHYRSNSEDGDKTPRPPAPPSPLIPPRRADGSHTGGATQQNFFRDPTPSQASTIRPSHRRDANVAFSRPSSQNMQPRHQVNLNLAPSPEPLRGNKDMSSGYASSYDTEPTIRNVTAPAVQGSRMSHHGEGNHRSEPIAQGLSREAQRAWLGMDRPEINPQHQMMEGVNEPMIYKRSDRNPSHIFQEASTNHRSPFVRNPTDHGIEILRPDSESAVKFPPSRGSNARRPAPAMGSKGNGRYRGPYEYPQSLQHQNEREALWNRLNQCERDGNNNAIEDEVTRRLEGARLFDLQALREEEARNPPPGPSRQPIDRNGRPVQGEGSSYATKPRNYNESVSEAMHPKDKHVAFQGQSEPSSTSSSTKTKLPNKTAGRGAEAASHTTPEQKMVVRRRQRVRRDMSHAEGKAQNGWIPDDQSLSEYGPHHGRRLLESPMDAGGLDYEYIEAPRVHFDGIGNYNHSDISAGSGGPPRPIPVSDDDPINMPRGLDGNAAMPLFGLDDPIPTNVPVGMFTGEDVPYNPDDYNHSEISAGSWGRPKQNNVEQRQEPPTPTNVPVGMWTGEDVPYNPDDYNHSDISAGSWKNT